MNRSFRILMGIGILAILVPAVAMVVPNDSPAKPAPNGGASSSEVALAAPQQDSTAATGAENPEDTTTMAGEAEANVAEITASADTMAPPDSTEDNSTAPSITNGTVNDNGSGHTHHGSTNTTAGKNNSNSPSGSTNTTKPTSPGTTHPPDHAAPAPAPAVSGTITGSACPCTVNGTVELKGVITLKGDIVVSGGTLVARPGVTVNGGGFQILFQDGGKADFQGTKTSTWSGDGSNANVNRDITFSNLKRIMFHQGAAKSILKYFTIKDSGASGVGNYPLHFHLNGNSTRGTIVEGVVVINGKQHAFVPHGSHGITFKDIIARNTTSTAIWWDPPGTNNCSSPWRKECTADNSNDIKVDHALMDGINGDNRVAGVRLGAGSGNSLTNSRVTRVRGGHDCSAYHWPEEANQNKGGNVWVFQNNTAGSVGECHGIFVWQNDGGRHVVQGFSGGGLSQGAYSNRYEYRNIDVGYVDVHAVDWQMRDSKAGKVVVFPHQTSGTVTFTNVTFASFTVSDDDGDNVPADYILNGTNMTCATVNTTRMLPGSRVIIDGQTC